MNRQRGVSLQGLMVVLGIVILVALLGMKVAPSFIEYRQILAAAKGVAEDPALKGGSVSDVRRAFSKYQEIDGFKKVMPADLEVTKDGGELLLTFAYEDRIRLFGKVSLLIEYEGSSNK